jgi:hypothetical protein
MANLAVIFYKSDLGGFNPMLHLRVAARAINFAIAHMRIVEQDFVLMFGPPFRFIMAVVTPLHRSLAIPLGDIGMAFFTGNMFGADEILVAEIKSGQGDVFRGDLMAGEAIPKRQSSLGIFPPFQVAKETGGVGHLKVRADHNLGMTGYAPQLGAVNHLPKMKFVVERNPFSVGNLFFQKLCGMTPFAQAAGVFNFGVGSGTVFLGYILNDRIDGLDLGPNRSSDIGRVVAFYAGNFAVL